MNKKFKFLTMLLALVMTLGAFAPFSARAEEAKETTEKVTLHKLVMSKEDLSKWDSDAIEKKGYNGTQDTDALKALLDAGHSAKEVAGVYFAVKNSEGNYVTIKEEAGKEPVYGEVDSLDATLDTGYKLLAGETTANGIVFNTAGLKGEYTIVEVHEKSTYVGENGEAITDNKAVPVVITLPLVNNDGVVKEAHVYPKNTEDKPKIDKNFSADEAKKYMSEDEKTKLDEAIAHKAAFEKAKKLYATTSKEYTDAELAYTDADKDLIKKWGIDFESNLRGKQTLDKKIGDDVEYTVVTDIPAQTKWATAKWDDKMTEGLTYNNGSLSVKLEILNEDGNYTEVALTKNTDYTLTETKDGFVLNFEKPGLDKLNNKAQSQIVTLKYSAKINNTTVTDVPESNDVTFHYGNTPGKGNTPIPTKPEEGKITVTKTMKDGQAWPEKGIKVQLVNANTGENVGQPVTLTSTKTTHTWEKLDAETEYKVIELTTGYDVVYGKGGDNVLGQITIDNYKTQNPQPLNPSEPKVVTGGKRFVKTNNEDKDSKELERLAGAEFYVKNAEGKYLVADKKDAKAVTDAKATLDAAVKTYNNLTAEEQKGQKGIDAKAAIDTAQEAYNKAFKENAIAYTWGEKGDDNVVVLTSDAQGRFEITGLEYGSYKLEEKTAPAGFAKLSGDVDFKVEEGSYDGSDTELKYNIEVKEGEKVVYGQQIKNKKVSIPQTGGIGTVIFTVVGVMLMVGAAFALKRRKEDELEGLA